MARKRGRASKEGTKARERAQRRSRERAQKREGAREHSVAGVDVSTFFWSKPTIIGKSPETSNRTQIYLESGATDCVSLPTTKPDTTHTPSRASTSNEEFTMSHRSSTAATARAHTAHTLTAPAAPVAPVDPAARTMADDATATLTDALRTVTTRPHMIIACPCGAGAHATTESPIHIYVCHCAMCPTELKRECSSGGAPWAAVPRVRWRDDSVIFHRSSSFAIRGSCTGCDRVLSMRYDCEEHTEWIHTDILHTEAASSVPISHIHVNGTGPFEDGEPCHDGFSPNWERNRDPCRPASKPAPTVCVKCNQLEGRCPCQTPYDRKQTDSEP